MGQNKKHCLQHAEGSPKRNKSSRSTGEATHIFADQIHAGALTHRRDA